MHKSKKPINYKIYRSDFSSQVASPVILTELVSYIKWVS